jgi:serine/threonine protein phosphatase PrpC
MLNKNKAKRPFDYALDAEVVEKVEVESNLSTEETPSRPQLGPPSTFSGVNWFDKSKRWCLIPHSKIARDIQSDYGVVDDVTIIAGSLRGRKHRVVGDPNEDAYAISIAETADATFLIAVICDGLSSASQSAWSAPATAGLVAQHARTNILAHSVLDQKAIQSEMTKAVKSSLKSLDEMAKTELDMSVIGNEAHFATTLTYIVIPTKYSLGSTVYCGYIGDSTAFLFQKPTWTPMLLNTEEKEIQSSVTEAFPISTTPTPIDFQIEIGDRFLLTSDGVGNYIGRDGQNLLLGDYIADKWATPVDELDFLKDLSFDIRSADDDRTIIALWVG